MVRNRRNTSIAKMYYFKGHPVGIPQDSGSVIFTEFVGGNCFLSLISRVFLNKENVKIEVEIETERAFDF